MHSVAVFCIRWPYLHSVEMAEPELVSVVSTIQVDQQQEQEKIRKTERTQSTRADHRSKVESEDLETRPLLRPPKRNGNRLTASTFGKLQP